MFDDIYDLLSWIILILVIVIFIKYIQNLYKEIPSISEMHKNLEQEFCDVINNEVKNIITEIIKDSNKEIIISRELHFKIMDRITNAIFSWWERMPKNIREQIQVLKNYNALNKCEYIEKIIEKLMKDIPKNYELNNENIQKYFAGIENVISEVSKEMNEDDEEYLEQDEINSD